jgi:hypothetical protein
MDNVLEAYAPFTSTALEAMTHQEDPEFWLLVQADPHSGRAKITEKIGGAGENRTHA